LLQKKAGTKANKGTINYKNRKIAKQKSQRTETRKQVTLVTRMFLKLKNLSEKKHEKQNRLQPVARSYPSD